MKNKIIIHVFIILISISGYSQIISNNSVYKYTYDASGNQTLRSPKEAILRSAMEREVIEKTHEELIEELKNKFQVSPNPTRGHAILSWEPEIAEAIWKVEVVSLVTSQKIEVTLTRANSVTINLSDKITGIYLVVFHLKNEQVPVIQKKLVKM